MACYHMNAIRQRKNLEVKIIMLTDIETLQKEIETFHNNVKYSNELTGLLSNIISALKNEEKLFDERIKALETTVSGTPEQLKIGNQDLIQQTLDNINRAKTDYEVALRTYLDELKAVPKIISDKSEEQYSAFLLEMKKENEKYVSVLQTSLEDIKSIPKIISDKNNAQYDEFLTSVRREYDDYVAVLRETQTKMEKISAELDSKYTAFLTKMESTNMDQIYKVCLDMDKKINNKLTLIIAGVAVAIILSVVAIIL